MPKKKIRDNAYYLERLKNERPDIYADLQAGKFANETEAFILAGLRKPATPLGTLRTAWSKASASERQAFLQEIGALRPAPAISTPIHPTTRVSTSSVLTSVSMPATMKAAIQGIMCTRGITQGQVMKELGRNPLDASLGMALQRDTTIQQDLHDDLQKWLQSQLGP